MALLGAPDIRAQDAAEPSKIWPLSKLRPGSCTFPDDTELSSPPPTRLLFLSYTVTPAGAFVQAEITRSSGHAEFDARQVERLKSCAFELGRLNDPIGNRRGRMVVWPGSAPQDAQPRTGVNLGPQFDLGQSACGPHPTNVPAKLALEGAQGVYHVRRWVRADGRPAFLEWLQATGAPALESYAFKTLTECAIRPGTDAEGRPQTGFLDQGFELKFH